MDKMKKLYETYKRCVVRISVKNSDGDIDTGTGFHIGDGYIVTAKHVIEGSTLEEIVGYPNSSIAVSNVKTYFHKDSKIDLAVLKTEFSLAYFMSDKFEIVTEEPVEKIDFIPFGNHLDDWLGDELILTKALLMGFPQIPFSSKPTMVAISGEVNAIVDRYDTNHPFFILSGVPRGGFSGGPVISEYGFLLGVQVHSLYEGGKPTELGFFASVSIEPLLTILHDNSITISKNPNILDMITYKPDLMDLLSRETDLVDIHGSEELEAIIEKGISGGSWFRKTGDYDGESEN